MSRALKDVIADLPRERQQKIAARHVELKNEAESLKALREAAGRAQASVAEALSIKQPSVSKIEKQTDMYLSTLRGYIEAMGGTLELVVKLPGKRTVRLTGLGDVTPAERLKPVKRRKAGARA